MTTKIDQKSYLQKYLSGPSKDKKKKKKKVVKGKGFKIIDDDLDLSKLRALEKDELDIYGEGEDAPQVAGIIDERPLELQKLEQFKTSTKWKVINQDDGFNSKIQIEEVKSTVKEVEKENEIIFGKMYSDSEDEREREANDKKEDSASPTRKKGPRKQNDSPPQRSRKKDDSDVSPPRKTSKKYDSDASPPRKSSKKYDSDASPPRKSSKKYDSDASPPRKSSKKYDSDASPPRKSSKHDSDASPPRKSSKTERLSRKDSSRKTDDRSRSKHDKASPSRKHSNSNTNVRQRNHDSDQSPPRKKDKSPRRETNDRKRDKSKKQSRWGDFEFEKNEVEMISKEFERKSKSEQRKKGSDSDLSPPRKDRDKRTDDRERQRRNDSDSDQSPPRKRDKYADKRSRDKDSNTVSKRYERDNKQTDTPPPSNKKMARTLEGKMAGLQDAKQLRVENESFRRKEDEVFSKMSDDVSGRNAKAVTRKGKRDTSEERNKQKDKAERQKEINDKYKMWSKGLKQIEDQQERMQDYMHEAAKPLARHKGDKDLEDRLKDIQRDGDPMLKYIRERKREAGQLPPERPSYKGSFPPNRFNIRPGHRWDGVDRSNGYEKKFFDQQSKRKAQEEEAYKWSTEDL